MLKYKQKILITLLAIIMLLICGVMILINANIANAEENSFYIEHYTNSNEFYYNNDVCYIENYLGNLHEPYNLTYSELPDLYGSTIKNSINGIMVSGDDPIVGIVPKELLKKPNQHYTYMGKEYGLFVKTETLGNNVLSNVIVYDIVNNYESTTNIGHMKFRINVLFQREYLYVANAGDYMLKTRHFIPIVPGDKVIYKLSENIDATFVLHAQQSDLVMPMPYFLDSNTMVLCDSQRYIVQDIVSTVALFNEQHLNDGDEGYSPRLDMGKFITQIDGDYKATVYDVNEKSFFEELFKTTLIAKVCDGLEYGFEKLGYGALWGLGEFAADAYDAYMETADRIQQLTRNFTYICKGTTSQDQLELTGQLAKFGLSTLQFFNDGLFGQGSYMFYDEGDFYEADYQIGYTPELDEYNNYKTPWEARLVRGFSLKFVDSNDKSNITTSSGVYDFFIADKEHKEYLGYSIANTTQHVSILPGGKNSLAFFPMLHSGKYKLTTVGANAPVKLSVNRGGIGSTQVYNQHFDNINENDIVFEFEIKQGTIYIFDVEYLNKLQQGNFDVSLEFIPQELTWGSNEVYVDNLHESYRIYSEKTSYLEAMLSKPNWGCGLYDKNLKQISDYRSLNKDEYHYIRVGRDFNVDSAVTINLRQYINIKLENIDNIDKYIYPHSKYYFDSDLVLPTPTKRGYEFAGWWTSVYDYGELVTSENIEDFDVRDITLYAKWKSITYNVRYVTNGGSGIEMDTYISNNSYQLRTDTYKDGYVLYGWYDNPEFTGDRIEVIEKGSVGDKVFYARWIKNEFIVTLDINKSATENVEAQLDTKTIFVNYNNYFTLPVPRIDEYDFDGWYYGDIQITNKNGESYNKFTFEQDIELTAGWTRSTFYICMNDDGNILWLAKENGEYYFTDKIAGLKKEDEMCPGCYIKSQLQNNPDSEYTKNIRGQLFKSGHIYRTMALEPKKIIKGEEFDENLCCWKLINFIQNNKNKIINIYPVYELESYTVMFDMNDNSQDIVTKTVYYGDSMTQFEIPTKLGYTFENWVVKNFANYDSEYGYVAKNFPAGFIFPQEMPDLTAGIENFVQPSIMLAPKYLSNEYTVRFVGENINFDAKKVLFGKSYSNNDKNAFPIPMKTGYYFDGWYSGTNGTGKKVVNEYGAIDSWNIANDCTLYAYFTPIHYQMRFDFCGGNGDVSALEVIFDQALPNTIAPTRTGYTFAGYFDRTDGNGTLYYNQNMVGMMTWTNTESKTLYAHWTANTYTVNLNNQGGNGGDVQFTVIYGQPLPDNLEAPSKMGNYFRGYYSDYDGRGTYYLDSTMKSMNNWAIAHDTTLYAKWEERSLEVYIYYAHFNGETYDVLDSISIIISGTETKQLYVKDFEGYTFSYWQAFGSDGPRRKGLEKVTSSTLTISYEYFEGILWYRNIFVYAYYDKNCIAEGSMITLADGSQKAVEDLTGNEQLLVWNLMTGKFDTAPILFIDSDSESKYQVVNLHFSDGTIVKVISEHAFWDFDLNKYVFLRNDADKYIGHWFNKQITNSNGDMAWTKVQLTNVQITSEKTRAFSPVTYSHLCYYVNGMLSIPGATEGLINIFEVDSQTMQIDIEKFNADIESYGLYSYEEFSQIVPVTEEVFNAFNGQYLKVAIGKGLTTIEKLQNLVAVYFN